MLDHIKCVGFCCAENSSSGDLGDMMWQGGGDGLRGRISSTPYVIGDGGGILGAIPNRGGLRILSQHDDGSHSFRNAKWWCK